MIVYYLDIVEVSRLSSSSNCFRQYLKIHRDIFKSIRSKQIYSNELLLKIAYNFPRYFINPRIINSNEIVPSLIVSQETIENAFKTYKIVKISRWDQIDSLMDCKLDKIGIFKLLLQNKSIDPKNALIYAIKMNYKQIVDILLKDDRIDPAANYNEALGLASAKGYLDIVQMLLRDERVDPSANNNFAIKWASRFNNTRVVNLLLSDPRFDHDFN